MSSPAQLTTPTPAPWAFAEETVMNPGSERLVRAVNGRIVAFVSRDCWENRDANAHLIAAAPDLLAALKLAFRFMCDINAPIPGDAYEAAEAALAKAEPCES